jgi:hypothetical protein
MYPHYSQLLTSCKLTTFPEFSALVRGNLRFANNSHR